MASAPTDLHTEPAIRALVDRLLLEQGRLDPLELLLATDLLAYEDYEAWRLGQRPDLQSALQSAPDDAAELLARAGAYATRQGLAPSSQEYRGWGQFGQTLCIGQHADLAAACAVAYAPPADRTQLDLFQDSSSALVEEALRRALAERRLDDARQQVAQLLQLDPRHPRLGGLLRLLQALDEGDPSETPPRPEDRLRDLEDLEPLAHRLLGHRARDFLTPLWAALAAQLSECAFDPACPERHASYAWQRAERWDAVRAAVESEPDWRAEPTLVLAHAEACLRRRATVDAWRDWMWLCWEHPLAAERALASAAFPDARLADLWGRFSDLEQELATEDFPAWLLLAAPGLAAAVSPEAAPSDERGTAYALLHALIGADDTIERRQALADAHPQLFKLYLSARGGEPGQAARRWRKTRV